MKNINKFQKNEEGFASIVIALVLITVMALITVGFAQLARREQQNALSNALSNQAYYAAETGVNDIYQGIENGTINSGTANATSTNGGGVNCLNATSPTLPNGYSTTINQQDGTTIACALLNLTPQQLTKEPIDAGGSWNNVFSTTGTLSSLTINWSSSDSQLSNGSFRAPRSAGDTSFPTQTNWSSPDVLEASITPLPANASQLTDTALSANTFNVYLYPSVGCGSSVYCVDSTVAYSPSTDQGQIVSGDCTPNSPTITNPTDCSATISGLPGTASEFYLIHVSSEHYDSSNLSTSAKDSGGNVLDFSNAQAVIDVTGKVHNVLKRIRAVVSLNGVAGNPGNSLLLPNDSIQSRDVCKEYDTYPGSFSNNSTTDTMCDPN
jgi:Tfp pilus assembly protein PilX